MTQTDIPSSHSAPLSDGGDAGRWDDLIARAENSLRRLASQLLSRSRSISRWEQTDDVLQESLLRLCHALQTAKIESPLHFYRLAALQIRRVLIDFARKYRGAHGLATNHGTGDVARWAMEQCHGDDEHREMGMLEWSEFHRIVSELPDEHREMFDLRWYAGLSTSEAARVLDASHRRVQRRWRAARLAFCRRWDAQVERGGWLDRFSDAAD